MSPAVIRTNDLSFVSFSFGCVSSYRSKISEKLQLWLNRWSYKLAKLPLNWLKDVLKRLNTVPIHYKFVTVAILVFISFTFIYWWNSHDILDYEEDIKSSDGTFFVRHDKSNFKITKQVCDFLKKHKMWFPRLNFVFVQLISGNNEKFFNRPKNGGLGVPDNDDNCFHTHNCMHACPVEQETGIPMSVPISGFYPGCPLLTLASSGSRSCYVPGAVPSYGPISVPVPPPRPSRRTHSRHSRPLRIGLESIAECDTEADCYNQTLTPPLLSLSSSSLTNSSWSSDVDESVSCSSSATDYSKTSCGSNGSQTNGSVIKNRSNQSCAPPMPVWTYQNYYQPVWLYRGKNDEGARSYMRDRMPVDNGYEDYNHMDQRAWKAATTWTKTTSSKWKNKLHKIGEWKSLKAWLRKAKITNI